MDKFRLINKYSITPASNNNYLAIKVINGLGNRIRAYSFYKALAKHLNRKLLLCWEKTIGFDDTPFNDFFSTEENLISGDEFDKIRNESINLNDFIQLSKCKQYEEYKGNNYIERNHKKEVIANIRKYKFNIFKFKLEANHTLPLSIVTSNIIWPNMLGIEQEFYDEIRNLKINNTLKTIIDDITSQFDRYTYGLHIRKGDVIDDNNPDSKEYLESHDDNYFINIINREIAQNDKVKFFLATDCGKTAEKFSEIYKDKIINNPLKTFHESKYHQPKQGQKDALIDICCLSKTNKIYGTTWSTFSWMGAIMGNVEIFFKQQTI